MTSYSSITKAFKRDDAKKDVTIEDAEKAVIAAEEKLQLFKHEINNVRQRLSIAEELWQNDR